MRLGINHRRARNDLDLVSADFSGPTTDFTLNETGVRLRAIVDQLDYVNFPLRGYRFEGETVFGNRSLSGIRGSEDFTRIDVEGTGAATWGRSTFNAHLSARSAGGADRFGLGRFSYSLGGFHRLSGYRYNQLAGSHVLFGRLTMYQRLKQIPLFTRGLFVGGSLEAGNAWTRSENVSLSDLRSGMSLFVGADTGLGPLYLGVTHAPRGGSGLYLFLGRP